MEILALESIEQLETIKNDNTVSIIFKHNTSCPISKNTMSNFEKHAAILPQETIIYFLDLLNYRDISNAIAEKFDVQHESPQLLVIKDGECMFNQSLYDISAKDAAEAIHSN